MDREYSPKNYWQGALIRLRGTRPEDAPKKWRERTDFEARRLLESICELPAPSYEAYAELYSQSCEFKDTSRYTPFSIETLAGEYVGWINLFQGDPRHGVFSFGLAIFPEYRRLGYAEEASRILMRYGFDELRCQKCDSACLGNNEGSIRLHQRLGFREEGRRRRTVYMEGQFYDELLFGILKEEFVALERRN